jgi:hypothetical protein
MGNYRAEQGNGKYTRDCDKGGWSWVGHALRRQKEDNRIVLEHETGETQIYMGIRVEVKRTRKTVLETTDLEVKRTRKTVLETTDLGSEAWG